MFRSSAMNAESVRICQEVAAMLLERGAWEQEDHKEEVLMHAEAWQIWQQLTFQTT